MTDLIHFISAATPRKPETIVSAECPGIRERRNGEVIHLRASETDTRCAKCGGLASPWVASEDHWYKVTPRCSL